MEKQTQTHAEICAKGGRSKSPAKKKAGQNNLAKARAALTAKRNQEKQRLK